MPQSALPVRDTDQSLVAFSVVLEAKAQNARAKVQAARCAHRPGPGSTTKVDAVEAGSVGLPSNRNYLFC